MTTKDNMFYYNIVNRSYCGDIEKKLLNSQLVHYFLAI